MHVAIIGSGISSLSTIHYFNRNIKIDLYESNDRMGGHTHTHSIKVEGKNVRVDTGGLSFLTIEIIQIFFSYLTSVMSI